MANSELAEALFQQTFDEAQNVLAEVSALVPNTKTELIQL
jgi:hypothetical protein